jgi:hypothetical protein
MKWFQLDTDMPHDPRIKAVARSLGVEGVGGLVLLWCHVARYGSEPGVAIDSAGQPLHLDDIQETTQLTREKFHELIDICVKTGHFRRETWEQHHGIWIPALQRRADTYARKRALRQQLNFTGQWS